MNEEENNYMNLLDEMANTMGYNSYNDIWQRSGPDAAFDCCFMVFNNATIATPDTMLKEAEGETATTYDIIRNYCGKSIWDEYSPDNYMLDNVHSGQINNCMEAYAEHRLTQSKAEIERLKSEIDDYKQALEFYQQEWELVRTQTLNAVRGIIEAPKAALENRMIAGQELSDQEAIEHLTYSRILTEINKLQP